MRIQRLAGPPAGAGARGPPDRDPCPGRGPRPVGDDDRAGPRRAPVTIGTPTPRRPRWAVEAAYEGPIRFNEPNLEDPASLQPIVNALTRWIASTLVPLADLPMTFLPPGEED